MHYLLQPQDWSFRHIECQVHYKQNRQHDVHLHTSVTARALTSNNVLHDLRQLLTCCTRVVSESNWTHGYAMHGLWLDRSLMSPWHVTRNWHASLIHGHMHAAICAVRYMPMDRVVPKLLQLWRAWADIMFNGWYNNDCVGILLHTEFLTGDLELVWEWTL